MRRSLWILLTPTVILLLGLFLFDRYVAPNILNFAIGKIEEVTKREGPFTVRIESAELSYFPIGLKARQVQLQPQKNLQKSLSEVSVQEIRVELALFAFVTGKLKIGSLVIDSPNIEAQFRLTEGSTKDNSQLSFDFRWNQLLETLELIPIEQISVKNLRLKLTETRSKKSVLISPVELQALKLPELLQVKVSAPEIFPSWDEKKFLRTGLQFSATLTPSEFRVQQFKIENTTLNFNLSGQVKANRKSKQLSTQAYWKAEINLDELQNALRVIVPDKKFPRLAGKVEANGNWEPQNDDPLRASFNVLTRQVSLADFRLGAADIKGSFSKNRIAFEEIGLNHPAGDLVLKKSSLTTNANLDFESELNLKTMDFASLFKSIKLPGVPLYGTAEGRAPCRGQFVPLKIDCDFQMSLNNFAVRVGQRAEEFEIVQLEKISGNGKLQVDADKISYDSSLSMPNSKGKSQGIVDFKKGFKIEYSASDLDWKDVKNLAGLSIEGKSQIKGGTEGNSRAATFNVELAGKEQAIYGYYLGELTTRLEYNDGVLNFPKLQAKISTSAINSQMKINLKDSTIAGELQSTQVDLEHIQKILAKPIPIPVPLAGSGQMRAQFSGPLDFWKLNLDLNARIQQPQIAGEIFNDLEIAAKSQQQILEIQKFDLVRGKNRIELKGRIEQGKDLDLQGTLQNGRLEESDNISRIGWPLSGDINAQFKLGGSLQNPELQMSGQISNMILDENQVSNSSFRLNIQNSEATAEGQFFGNQVQSQIRWPLSNAKSPVQFRFKSTDWDYTPWLSLFNAGAINEETKGQLSSDIDLVSESGSWKELTGNLKFESLSLTRQSLTLANPNPMIIQAQKGKYKTQNFLLKDQEDGVLRIRMDESSLESLNLSIEASTDIKLLQIFIPLFEEISGQIQLNAKVAGPIEQPVSVGEMSLKNGYFKIKNFPHAFEKMSVQSTFSQSRLLLNDIQGQLGGGTIRGEGSLQFQGAGDLPLFIRARAQDISLNVPNGVRTRGDAEISLTGRRFPYVLGVNYRIRNNLVEMNFGNDSAANTNKRNEYLPQSIKEQIQEPLELDLQLSFEKPLQIKNSLMEAQATGNLSIKGSPANPILQGQLKSLKGSQLFFKDKPFQIQTANIQFLNPKEINPELFISAQTRVDVYDVSLLVQGTAKEPTIRLSSVPPLSDNDLTSLLALGVTSSKLAEVESKEQQTQTANEVFAAAFQSTGLSKKVQSATGFNVQLSNSFDTTRNISVPKFTVSRKLNKRTNATVAFPVTGDQKTPEGKIQYNITDTFSINGSYETRKFDQNTTNIEQRETPSILGVDLEFSREFK